MDNVKIRRAQLIDALGPILGRWAEIDGLSDAESEYDSAWQDKHRPTCETLIIKTLGGDAIHVAWDSEVRLLGEWVHIDCPCFVTYAQAVYDTDGSWLGSSYENQPSYPTVATSKGEGRLQEMQIRAKDISCVYAYVFRHKKGGRN